MGKFTQLLFISVAVLVGINHFDPISSKFGQQLVDDYHPAVIAEILKTKANNMTRDYFENLSNLYNNSEKPYAFYTQAFALGMIFYIVLFKRSYDPTKKGYGGRAPTPLSRAEQDTLIEEWAPEPLINLGIDTRANELGTEHVLTTRLAARVKIQGIEAPVINLAGYDFLGMSQEDSINEACKECLRQYGCGSCGPRGFYGTSDLHLDLENGLKSFFGTEEAIVYSDAACTMCSVIPAFAKRGDVIVADLAVSESALAGIELSRCTVGYFKHNDVTHLAQLLEQMTQMLKRKGKNPSTVRRYVVIEGLYRNTGDFAPLAEIVKCARKYKYRIILDDSFALGTAGKTGRGSLERANLKVTDVDILAGSLACSLGSIGGFCTGTHVAVDHQRLNAPGYVFSASAPPFTCVAAIEALKLIDQEPERLEKLHSRIRYARNLADQLPNVKIVSDTDSPMIYLELADGGTPNNMDERYNIEKRIQDVVDACLEGGLTAVSSHGNSKKGAGGGEGVLVSRSRTVNPPPKSKRPPMPNPSLRICVCSILSDEDLDAAFATLNAALQ